MIFLPSLEQGIRTQLPGIFFCSRVLHLFHKPQSPSGLLILRLVWSTFFTTSLLHSLHKCSASLREHGPQKASREVSSALTNEYDQNHVKLSDPLAELGRPAHSSPSHRILPRAALFGTFIEHLVHLFRDEGKTLYASLIISANRY